MPQQAWYRVRRPDGTTMEFPPGTKPEIMDKWAAGDDSVLESLNAPPGLPDLGMSFPDVSKEKQVQQGKGGLLETVLQPRQGSLSLRDLGKVIEFVSGFTPARPLPLLAGMATSAIGNRMAGGDASDNAASAALTGSGGVLHRIISEGGTAAGLRTGLFTPNPDSQQLPNMRDAWSRAQDFYDLKPTYPTIIGNNRRIQEEVSESGRALGEAMQGKEANLADVVAGAAKDAKLRSPKARGTDPVDFGKSAEQREMQVLQQRLLDPSVGLTPGIVMALDLNDLRGIAKLFNIPLEDVAAIKQVSGQAGVKLRNASEGHKQLLENPADATAETNAAISSKARKVQAEQVGPQLKRAGRAQRVDDANYQVLSNENIPPVTKAIYSGGGLAGLYRSMPGSPRFLSIAGLSSAEITRLLLAGYKFSRDGKGLIKDE